MEEAKNAGILHVQVVVVYGIEPIWDFFLMYPKQRPREQMSGINEPSTRVVLPDSRTVLGSVNWSSVSISIVGVNPKISACFHPKQVVRLFPFIAPHVFCGFFHLTFGFLASPKLPLLDLGPSGISS